MAIFATRDRYGNAALLVGEQLLSLYRDTHWIVRRIETVDLLGIREMTRRITVDIDAAVVWRRQPNAALLADSSFRPIPIASIEKELLMDFDLKGEGAQSVALPSREDDSTAACLILIAAAARVLHRLPRRDVSQRLFDIAYDFPSSPRRFAGGQPLWPESWAPLASWARDTRTEWDRLTGDEDFSRLLYDFTYSFLLLAPLQVRTGNVLFKYSFRSFNAAPPLSVAQKIGLLPAVADIPIVSASEARSYHLRFNPPAGMVITGARVGQTFLRTSGVVDEPVVYERITRNGAQFYLSGDKTRRAYVAQFDLRVPVAGFLRTSLTSLLAALVLYLIILMRLDLVLDAMKKNADATVTLLLALPLALTVFLVRPREHRILNRVLRFSRYFLAATCGLLFLLAGWLLFSPVREELLTLLTFMVPAGAAMWLLVALAVYRTTRDVKRASGGEGGTRRTRIEILFPW